jgi:hypothetical protein
MIRLVPDRLRLPVACVLMLRACQARAQAHVEAIRHQDT